MSASSPAPSDIKEITPLTKLWFSAIGGLIFIVVSLPAVYKVVDSVVGAIYKPGVISNAAGAPTLTGIIVHAVVFTLLIWLTMEPWKTESRYGVSSEIEREFPSYMQ